MEREREIERESSNVRVLGFKNVYRLERVISRIKDWEKFFSLSKTLKPTTQIQKPSHIIQNRQNNMKHIALISAKLKYIHTHKQNINIHTDQMDSKAKSTQ